MLIAAKATEEQKKEILSKKTGTGTTIYWLQEGESLSSINADAYFDFMFDSEFIAANEFIHHKPVFVNAVCCTTSEIGQSNYVRINAWPGFLARDVMEIAASGEGLKNAEIILQTLEWNYALAPDEPGMIAARVISMIINEAHFGLADGISTREEIDTAMRLGTNYPFGPFEWCRKIGAQNVYNLLTKLYRQFGGRYAPAPLLEQEANNNGINS